MMMIDDDRISRFTGILYFSIQYKLDTAEYGQVLGVGILYSTVHRGKLLYTSSAREMSLTVRKTEETITR
jgi:hypothetical protein